MPDPLTFDQPQPRTARRNLNPTCAAETIGVPASCGYLHYIEDHEIHSACLHADLGASVRRAGMMNRWRVIEEDHPTIRL
ncbi:MAG: hypothetical protein IAE94_00465 [Chthoniobacterales bacterium]|nr:hypothetical protein [Chthoniobacterales bacterium]